MHAPEVEKLIAVLCVQVQLFLLSGWYFVSAVTLVSKENQFNDDFTSGLPTEKKKYLGKCRGRDSVLCLCGMNYSMTKCVVLSLQNALGSIAGSQLVFSPSLLYFSYSILLGLPAP